MSNHFPSVPTLNLFRLSYNAVLPYPLGEPDSAVYNTVKPGYCGTGTSGYTTDHNDSPAGPSNGTVIFSPVGNEDNMYLVDISVTFDTPGSAGDFDQDTMEASVSSTLNSIVDAISSVTGSSTSTVAGWITVNRCWEFQDSSNAWYVAYNDTMVYTY